MDQVPPLPEPLPEPTPIKPERKPLPTSVKVFLGILGVVLIGVVVTFLVLRSERNREPEPTPTTAEEEPQGDPTLLVSFDSGATWNAIAGSAGLVIESIEFKSGDANQVYIGTKGQGLWIYNRNEKTLEQVKDPDENLLDTAEIYDIKQNLDGNSLFLALFQNRRGRVIRLVESGSRELYAAPLEGYGIFGVAIDPRDTMHVNIAVGDGSFLESADGGTPESWEVIARFREGVVDLETSSTAPTRMWALGNQGELYTTQSQGRSWVARPRISVDGRGISKIHDMRYHTARGALMLGTDYGLIESYNDGVTWESFQTLIPPGAAAVNAIDIHPRFAESFWMSSANRLYHTEDGGITWEQTILSTPLTVSTLRVNPEDPTMLYAGLTRQN